MWEFPGGKVEAGEGDAEALARECAEELDVAIAVGESVWSTIHEYEDLVVELVLLRATMSAEARPVARDAAVVSWVERSKLIELEFCAADRPIVALLARAEL